LCIAQKSLNFCLAFSYSIVTTFAVVLIFIQIRIKTKATATAIVMVMMEAREAKEIRIKKRAKVNHSFNY
jgi:hypothetical protein